MAEIRWTRRALGDLHDIYDFIAKDSPRYAAGYLQRIFNAVPNLAQFPELGRKLPEFPELPYREIIVGNYRLMYRVEQGVVLIMAVLHGRRLLKAPPE